VLVHFRHREPGALSPPRGLVADVSPPCTQPYHCTFTARRSGTAVLTKFVAGQFGTGSQAFTVVVNPSVGLNPVTVNTSLFEGNPRSTFALSIVVGSAGAGTISMGGTELLTRAFYVAEQPDTSTTFSCISTSMVVGTNMICTINPQNGGNPIISRPGPMNVTVIAETRRLENGTNVTGSGIVVVTPIQAPSASSTLVSPFVLTFYVKAGDAGYASIRLHVSVTARTATRVRKLATFGCRWALGS
jgi:hypothetical protein